MRQALGAHGYSYTLLFSLYEPVSSKRYTLACAAPIEESPQTAHLCTLIRVFDMRSISSHWQKVSSGGKLRLRSDCAVAQTDLKFCYTHMLNW